MPQWRPPRPAPGCSPSARRFVRGGEQCGACAAWSRPRTGAERTVLRDSAPKCAWHTVRECADKALTRLLLPWLHSCRVRPWTDVVPWPPSAPVCGGHQRRSRVRARKAKRPCREPYARCLYPPRLRCPDICAGASEYTRNADLAGAVLGLPAMASATLKPCKNGANNCWSTEGPGVHVTCANLCFPLSACKRLRGGGILS